MSKLFFIKSYAEGFRRSGPVLISDSDPGFQGVKDGGIVQRHQGDRE